MAKILVIFLCLISLGTYCQYPDTDASHAVAYFKEAKRASQKQHIWEKDVYGPTLFVDPTSRRVYANTPDSAGILQPAGPIYTGFLPKDVMIANTAINWQGVTWSVILWPLPEDKDERVSLILHESFHRIQNELGFPANNVTAKHLDTLSGRYFFLLELQALKTALSKPVNQRGADLLHALLFAQKRERLFPGSYNNERILEMNEGLAEYTGVILGWNKKRIRQHLYEQIDSAGKRPSLIRAFANIIGPVYGYLLYEKAKHWTHHIDSNARFTNLVAQYYHIDKIQMPDSNAFEVMENEYQGLEILHSEQLRENRRQEMSNHYRQVFTNQPVLKISLIKMNISFNPNTMFDLGSAGTVYPTAEVKDVWGKLTVSSGGMLMKDWKEIFVPAFGGLAIEDPTITGKGWILQLNKGWKVVQRNDQFFLENAN